MKKVKSRAAAAIFISVFLILGLVLFVFRLAINGGDWAVFFSRSAPTGHITDRNGVTLYSSDGETYGFAEEQSVRLACYQLVGDVNFAVDTGILRVFRSELSSYSFISGAPKVKEMKLTIDAELQKTAYAALGGRNGTVMLMNYMTGEVLCMVSNPTQDPMAPYTAPQDGTYLNKCLRGTFVPGSIFKIVTAAAALENIPGIDERTFSCPGSIIVENSVLNCHGTHGDQHLQEAFENSCNCAFAELALEIGPKKLAEYAQKLGLCSENSLSGIWTQACSVGELKPDSIGLAWTGAGQHEAMVNPYAMLRLVSAIANNGTLVRPGIKLAEEHGVKEKELLSPQTAQKLKEMMAATVENEYGSWRFPHLRVCAKTGTAETGEGSSHSWFTGFADNPEHPLCFVVLVEHGGAGLGAAAEVTSIMLNAAAAN